MWGRSSRTVSTLSPKRDWGPKRVNKPWSYSIHIYIYIYIYIYTRAVSRHAARQPHALLPPSCACQPVVKTVSKLHTDAPSSSYAPLRSWVTDISFIRVNLIGELFFHDTLNIFFRAIFINLLDFPDFFTIMCNLTKLIFLLLENFTKSDRTPPYIDAHLSAKISTLLWK